MGLERVKKGSRDLWTAPNEHTQTFLPTHPHIEGGKLRIYRNPQLLGYIYIRFNPFCARSMHFVSQNGRLADVKTQSQSLRIYLLK